MDRLLAGVAIAVSVILLALLVARATTTADMNWDTTAYHKAFSARLVDMCDKDCFAMTELMEGRYQSFPVAAELIKGVMWKVTGKAEAPNFLALVSLIALIVYLQAAWGVPWYWSTVAFLAIPMVQAHATSEYIDLSPNVAIAIACLVLLRLQLEPDGWTRANLLTFAASTIYAANAKLLLIPVAGILYAVLGVMFLIREHKRGGILRGPALIGAGLLTVLGLLVSAPVIKNTIMFGNPVYPVPVNVLGVALPGTEKTDADTAPPYLHKVSGPLRWLLSIVEYSALDERPIPYTLDQGSVRPDAKSIRMGGYGVGYVLISLCFLGAAICRSPAPQRNTLLAMFGGISLLAAVLPASYELRYYMFWMLVLVALGLIFFARRESAGTDLGTAYRLVILVMLVSTTAWTGGAYFKRGPKLRHVVSSISAATVAQVKDGEVLCIPDSRIGFLYSRLFYPGRHYATIIDESCPQR